MLHYFQRYVPELTCCLMSSVSSDVSGLADISFRKESICEEPIGEILVGISYCKDRLKECMSERASPVKQMYLDKIVQLNLERQSLEENGVNGEDSAVKALGHEFVLQRSSGRRNPYCEVCMSTIWRMVQSWRRCKKGPANMQPRLCDYTGLLFCSNCHWNDTWSIPARIFHNMDAKPRPVCRAVKQLLAIVDNRPLIDISEAHPSLVKYHKELRRVQQLRRNFLTMKCYFVSCRSAGKLRILQYLNRHQHFVEGTDMYSLAELRELCLGNLLRELEDIHTVFKRHIEEECETCAGNGFYCELCEEPDQRDQVIFPFSENVAMCPKCLAVFHSKCFERRSSTCTR
ncbi:unnamed protein product [Nippostrongylus brasiliensis]|uniref:Differentially expressed in FDCP 8 homolog (inferred by orthology to a C. elegans protein) n=1 Tax=Nippostrongylus brasiliensis TaxID=27835 RepID=A0A0N4Y0N6_NIPBR|nr:unnamed protein product [Nippostrongylus brasiliensis]